MALGGSRSIMFCRCMRALHRTTIAGEHRLGGRRVQAADGVLGRLPLQGPFECVLGHATAVSGPSHACLSPSLLLSVVADTSLHRATTTTAAQVQVRAAALPPQRLPLGDGVPQVSAFPSPCLAVRACVVICQFLHIKSLSGASRVSATTPPCNSPSSFVMIKTIKKIKIKKKHPARPQHPERGRGLAAGHHRQADATRHPGACAPLLSKPARACVGGTSINPHHHVPPIPLTHSLTHSLFPHPAGTDKQPTRHPNT